jgi:hypothetical protein
MSMAFQTYSSNPSQIPLAGCCPQQYPQYVAISAQNAYPTPFRYATPPPMQPVLLQAYSSGGGYPQFHQVAVLPQAIPTLIPTPSLDLTPLPIIPCSPNGMPQSPNMQCAGASLPPLMNFGSNSSMSSVDSFNLQMANLSLNTRQQQRSYSPPSPYVTPIQFLPSPPAAVPVIPQHRQISQQQQRAMMVPTAWQTSPVCSPDPQRQSAESHLTTNCRRNGRFLPTRSRSLSSQSYYSETNAGSDSSHGSREHPSRTPNREPPAPPAQPSKKALVNKAFVKLEAMFGKDAFDHQGNRGENIIRLKVKTQAALAHIIPLIEYCQTENLITTVSCPISTKKGRQQIRGFLAYLQTRTESDCNRLEEMVTAYNKVNNSPFSSWHRNPQSTWNKPKTN